MDTTLLLRTKQSYVMELCVLYLLTTSPAWHWEDLKEVAPHLGCADIAWLLKSQPNH